MVKQKLIPVHVAWNNEVGDVDRLTHVEFTSDCELCAVETDVIDGDPITITDNTFTIFLTEEQQEKNEGGETFAFNSLSEFVGNIMWDVVWMTPAECGRFAVYLAQKRHWTVSCAMPEIMSGWKTLSSEDFQQFFLDAMDDGT